VEIFAIFWGIFCDFLSLFRDFLSFLGGILVIFGNFCNFLGKFCVSLGKFLAIFGIYKQSLKSEKNSSKSKFWWENRAAFFVLFYLGFCEWEFSIYEINFNIILLKTRNNLLNFLYTIFPSLQSSTNIIYKLNDAHFVIDESSGELKLIKKINQTTRILLNVTACYMQEINELCSSQLIKFELRLLPLLNESSDSDKTQNKNAPVFEHQSYAGKIREDSLPGTVVATVHARDSDQEKEKCCEYFIVAGDELNEFAISNDGKVYTRLLLDRERIQAYSFTLMAFDGKHKALSNLIVNVLDVDDDDDDDYTTISNNNNGCPLRPEKSLIHINVSESIRVDTSIYTIGAHKNPNTKYEIVFDHMDSSSMLMIHQIPFSIDTHGHLRTRASLDYEQTKAYEFLVKLSNNNNNKKRKLKFCQCKIVIHVVDENDNAPKFNESTYAVSIVENEKANRILTRVYALDSDSNLNGVVR
jgi:hypothetical protein